MTPLLPKPLASVAESWFDRVNEGDFLRKCQRKGKASPNNHDLFIVHKTLLM